MHQALLQIPPSVQPEHEDVHQALLQIPPSTLLQQGDVQWGLRETRPPELRQQANLQPAPARNLYYHCHGKQKCDGRSRRHLHQPQLDWGFRWYRFPQHSREYKQCNSIYNGPGPKHLIVTRKVRLFHLKQIHHPSARMSSLSTYQNSLIAS